MLKNINVSKIVKHLGSLLTLIALIFVCRSAWFQREFLLDIDLQKTLPIILIGILAYLIANFFLALAWWLLLHWFGETSLDFITSIAIYGKSQILKYIPGNIFYLPGRHLLSLEHGAKHGPLAGAATFEIIGLFAAASGMSILGILFADQNNTPLSAVTALTILLAAIASPLIIKTVLSYDIVSRRVPIFKTMNWGKYHHLIVIWLLYICFFFITGFILRLTILITPGSSNLIPLHTALFIFAISWLLGTITPGAPAGAGIREGIIIVMLSNYIGEPASILVALIMRIITSLGDIAFYFVSVYLGGKSVELNQLG